MAPDASMKVENSTALASGQASGNTPPKPAPEASWKLHKECVVEVRY